MQVLILDECRVSNAPLCPIVREFVRIDCSGPLINPEQAANALLAEYHMLQNSTAAVGTRGSLQSVAISISYEGRKLNWFAEHVM
jgi:hypothetical protein